MKSLNLFETLFSGRILGIVSFFLFSFIFFNFINETLGIDYYSDSGSAYNYVLIVFLITSLFLSFKYLYKTN